MAMVNVIESPSPSVVDGRLMYVMTPRGSFATSDRTSTGKTVRRRKDARSCISSAWRATLAVDEVDVRTSFFDLGGNSLLLLELHGDELPAAARDYVGLVNPWVESDRGRFFFFHARRVSGELVPTYKRPS